MKISFSLLKFYKWCFYVEILVSILVLLFGCDLFLSERTLLFTLPDKFVYGDDGPSPVRFHLEVTSSSGTYSEFSGNPGESISLSLKEEFSYVILAYPVFENSRFEVKPKGAFYISGITSDMNLTMNSEQGAALIPLAELFRYGFSLPGFNCYRYSQLFYDRSSTSPFAFDFPQIKSDIVTGEFSTFSLKKLTDYSISILGVPEGLYFPSDPFLEIVTVDVDGLFETDLYVGSHQYLNTGNNSILEVSCDENGSVVFLILYN